VLKFAIPVLHVSDSTAAERFYGQLGFQRKFAYRLDEAKPDPCYMGLSRDGVWLHLSSFSGDGVAGGVVYIAVEKVNLLHAELATKGVPIDTGPVDQSWGNREMYVKDPDRNSIRFVEEGIG
jgi:catechol 2,3-dioxygenase-like lactoylglutathione lyase family enzyme